MDHPIRPLVLIRGYGGPDVSGERASPYQGFNDGTVYPGKRGENYIYEGFLLRALKSSRFQYTDATNVIGYYAEDVESLQDDDFTQDMTSGSVVIDPATARQVLRRGIAGTIWIYRYYDLSPRSMERYGEGLARLFQLLEQAATARGEPFRGVDVIAHSMGGLVAREALRQLHTSDTSGPAADGRAGVRGKPACHYVHKIVTLGTPHRGIAFQRIPRWLLDMLPGLRDGAKELAAFDPTSADFLKVGQWFEMDRILTVVGTNYRSYGTAAASLANRLSSILDEGTLANRSDGLVKQSSAQLPGAPRTFVHKCHGGPDSLVTSREAYEIAMRFFHGTHRVRVWLDDAEVLRGMDAFGRSEFFFGIRIKPRGVDFELFHQSPEAENCYGPFRDTHLTDGPPDLATELRKALDAAGDRTTGWAGPNRLVWEGWVDRHAVPENEHGLVFRLDVLVSERDSFGIGFSDNIVFTKQYYVQVLAGEHAPVLLVHTGEQYVGPRTSVAPEQLLRLAGQKNSGVQRAASHTATKDAEQEWTFEVAGTGFRGVVRVGMDEVEDATTQPEPATAVAERPLPEPDGEAVGTPAGPGSATVPQQENVSRRWRLIRRRSGVVARR